MSTNEILKQRDGNSRRHASILNGGFQEYAKIFFQAEKLGLPMTLHCLPLAYLFHDGQKRKTGEPYVTHPLRVACLLLDAGIREDVILASAFYDVLEDCSEWVSAATLESTYRVDREVVEVVNILTKRKVLTTDEYYSGISCSPRAALVKIADRIHNLNTMKNAFSEAKMWEYIEETEEFVIPLCNQVCCQHPEYMFIAWLLKKQIQAIVRSSERVLGKLPPRW